MADPKPQMRKLSVPIEVEYDWDRITVDEIVRLISAVPGVVQVTQLAIGFRTETVADSILMYDSRTICARTG
jgi:hypothetical protein